MAESLAERVAREYYDRTAQPGLAPRLARCIQAAIDEAVLAEREACAEIADAVHTYLAVHGFVVFPGNAIRARSVGAPTSKP